MTELNLYELKQMLWADDNTMTQDKPLTTEDGKDIESIDCEDNDLLYRIDQVQSAKRLLKQKCVEYHILNKYIIELIDECLNIPDGTDDKKESE